MRYYTIAICACFAMILAPMGCGRKSMIISVRDTQTHQPVGGARVRVWNFRPAIELIGEISGITDSSGSVTLVAPLWERMQIKINAEGYDVKEILTKHPALGATGEWFFPGQVYEENAKSIDIRIVVPHSEKEQ